MLILKLTFSEKMEKDLISVIVPIYNVENYLEKCVNSILKQTYKNLEIILVDDGSTDNSGALCDEFAKQDSRVKVIHKVNGGLSDARNYGIEIAKGEFIAFIDSDDFIALDFYEYLFSLQKENNADIVECNFIKVYEEKQDTFEFSMKKENIILKTDGVGALFLFMSDDDEISTNSVVVWNKLYKRSLFEDIRFPVGKTHEDQFTTYKILAKAKSFVTSNQVKYGYFQRTNSIVNKKFNQKRFDTFEAFDKFLEYYNFMGYDDFKEKILRRYIKTAINFVPLLNSSDEAQRSELKEKLKEIFYNKYNFIIDYISKSNVHFDKMNMYEELKIEFEKRMSKIS